MKKNNKMIMYPSIFQTKHSLHQLKWLFFLFLLSDLSNVTAQPVPRESKQKSNPKQVREKKDWHPRKDCKGLYGKSESEKALKIRLKTLMKQPDHFKGKLIELSGQIDDVCPVKGCWLMLKEGEFRMRVRFKGYKFFVPTNSKGYRATVQGYGKMSIISERMARHYALDSGKKEAAKKIKGPQKVVTFMASSVNILPQN